MVSSGVSDEAVIGVGRHIDRGCAISEGDKLWVATPESVIDPHWPFSEHRPPALSNAHTSACHGFHEPCSGHVDPSPADAVSQTRLARRESLEPLAVGELEFIADLVDQINR